MPGYIKVWIKMIIDFIFSVSIITAVFSYSLLRTLTSEKLSIIISENGVSGSQVILESGIPGYVMRNFLWFSVFTAIFCLIILFFMEPKLKVFLFPGSLCFLSVLFIQVAMMIGNSFISTDTPVLTAEYISSTFSQANRASLVTGGAGMILLIISNFNLYQSKKQLQDKKK